MRKRARLLLELGQFDGRWRQSSRTVTSSPDMSSSATPRPPFLASEKRRLSEARSGPTAHLRMLTARAITSATVTSETSDWASMVSFAHRDNGMTSVGLNAVALVNDRYR